MTEPEQQEQKPKPLVLTITLDPEKGLNVNGPGNGKLFDEPMCLWMLKKAEEQIFVSNMKATQSKIIKPGFRGIKGAFGRK